MSLSIAPDTHTPNSETNVVSSAHKAPTMRTEPGSEQPAPTGEPLPIAPEPAALGPGKKRSPRSFLLPLALLALLGSGGWYGYGYWTEGRFMISTDNAYVKADMAFVTPKIGGYVIGLNAAENQFVRAGDAIVTIDDGDYRIVVSQAEAAMEIQNRTLQRIAAQSQAARAALGEAEAQKLSNVAAAGNARRIAERTAQLRDTQVATQARLDDARTAVEQADAALAAADARIASAKANIDVLEAQYQEALAALQNLRLARDKATRDLSFTVLRAPYDGVVGNLAVEQGDFVSPGQKLAVVVPVDRLYVVANFKETQLERLVPGEKVKLRVDAVEDEAFEGVISSLAPASGAVFSLLPPENATGNFTKIVQRVPVRIDLSAQALASGKLRAGLSVIVDVDSRTAPEPQAAQSN